MTNKILISDNASTTLAAGIAANSPSMQVVSGAGALFPVLASNQAFVCTLVKSGAPTIREVVLVQGHASGSDNFTNLGRNLSGTGALAWNAGDIVEMRPTAETFASFAQIIDLQSQSTNYSIDSGSANAYIVILAPALNGRIVGMPIRWQASHNNTGPSTFNDGLGAANFITLSGNSLQPGDIVAGGMYVTVWDGTNYRLLNIQRILFSYLLGQIASAQVPVGAIIQWQSSLVIAFSQLTGQIQNGQIATNINLPGIPTVGATPSTGDSSGKVADTAFVNPGSSIGSNGYRKYPDGLMEQWGQYSVSSGLTVPVDISITYPTTFPVACYGVWPVANRRVGAAGQAANGSNFSSQVTTSGATLTIDNNGASAFVGSWRALGRWA